MPSDAKSAFDATSREPLTLLRQRQSILILRVVACFSRFASLGSALPAGEHRATEAAETRYSVLPHVEELHRERTVLVVFSVPGL